MWLDCVKYAIDFLSKKNFKSKKKRLLKYWIWKGRNVIQWKWVDYINIYTDSDLQQMTYGAKKTNLVPGFKFE